jgi:hypothetical protein
MNRLRNFTLSHNETSTAKIDHKNEISAKNWIGSTWVAKSQLWKKVNVAGQKSTPGQHPKSTVKVNVGQQKSQL